MLAKGLLLREERSKQSFNYSLNLEPLLREEQNRSDIRSSSAPTLGAKKERYKEKLKDIYSVGSASADKNRLAEAKRQCEEFIKSQTLKAFPPSPKPPCCANPLSPL